MGRRYSGILTLVAATVVLVQAIRGGGSVDQALTTAMVGGVLFAAAGWLLGSLAQQTIDHATQMRLEEELAALTAAEATAPTEQPAS